MSALSAAAWCEIAIGAVVLWRGGASDVAGVLWLGLGLLQLTLVGSVVLLTRGMGQIAQRPLTSVAPSAQPERGA